MSRLLASLLAVIIGATVLAGCGLLDDGPNQGGDPPQLIIESTEGGDDEDQDPTAPTFPSSATKNTVRVAGESPAADAGGVASAVFPATSEATRPNAVALVDSDDWQSAVAASVLTFGKVGAPLLLSDGDELPPVTAAALSRLDPSGSEFAENAQVIRIGDEVARPEGRRTAVIGGGDQYVRAAAIDRFSAAAEGRRSSAVVVASGERAEWAMPAGAWAARSGDAVLFTERDTLPAPTREAIEAHEKPEIYVLGPDSVVSEQVVDDLEELGQVRRIEGPTPVENAIEFARYQTPNFGWGIVTPGHTFSLASTSRPLDAAAAAALGTEGTYAPLLLTDSADALPRALEGYFLDVQPGFEENPNEGVFNRVWILGDQSTISVAQQSRIDELTQLVPVRIDEGAGDGADQGAGGGGSGGAKRGGGGGRD